LQEAAKQPDSEKSILDLKVCDPACGSGHFLIAAAHRMANRLAAVRTGDAEPSPEAVRKALRDIVGRCLYGVDINPMAVELCKVNLWLEALEPGKPLSFLEHHIQCGNALLGATPALLKSGIPDGAFEPLEGDDKSVCRIFRKKNNAERERGQTSLLEAMHEGEGPLRDLAAGVAELDAITHDTLDGLRAKQAIWEQLVCSSSYEFSRLLADAWCAAFVWKKTSDSNRPYPVTEAVFRQIERDPLSVPDWMRMEIRRLADDYQFFHWQQAFPSVFPAATVSVATAEDGVGKADGFALILGNPPWEMPETDDRTFFQGLRPDIAAVSSPHERAALVRSLVVTDPAAFRAWEIHIRRRSAERKFFSNSASYPQSGKGRLNYYKLFLEGAWGLLRDRGHLAMVIPSGLATNAYEQPLWHFLLQRHAVRSLYDFENAEGLFPAVDRRAKFSLVTLSRSASRTFRVGCWLHSVHELCDPSRTLALSLEELQRLSPEALALPQFRTARDLTLLQWALGRHSRLAAAGDWRHTTRLMFSSSDKRFSPVSNVDVLVLPLTSLNRRKRDGGEEIVPVYEGKMVGQYDHRQADIRVNRANAARPAQETPLSDGAKTDPLRFVVPQYWIAGDIVRGMLRGFTSSDWLLAFCDVTSATNERTAIASILPLAGLTRSMPAIHPEGGSASSAALLLALLNSFVFDYFARLNVASNHLTQGILENLPVPEMACDIVQCLPANFFGSRVLELSYTAWDIQPFARDLGHGGPPFRWDPQRRFQIRCELDAGLFHLYGIGRPEVEYIMDTFPIVRSTEEKEFSEYRSKRLILEIYDRMQESADGRRPYQTAISPPPADPGLTHLAIAPR
jgi:hypothetical protein